MLVDGEKENPHLTTGPRKVRVRKVVKVEKEEARDSRVVLDHRLDALCV